MYQVLICHSLSSPAQKQLIQTIIAVGMSIMLILSMIVFIGLDLATGKTVLGLLGDFYVILFYTSPLSARK